MCESRPAPRSRRYNRTAILEVARLLLRSKGLVAISMEEVAAQAGLTRRTIYNHFGNTAQLFELSRKTLLAELTPLVPTRIEHGWPMSRGLTDFADRVARLFRDERHRDLYLSLTRDGQAWLEAAYQKQILAPMADALAAYLSRQWPHVSSAASASAAARLLMMIQATSTTPPPFERLAPGDEIHVPPAIMVQAILAQYTKPRAIAA